VVGQDGWGDAVPVVAALVERGDMLSLEIDLRRCDARECRFAWQALALEGEGSEDAATTTGTCFAVSPDGLVLTAQHVVEGAARIAVRFVGGAPLLAKVEKVDSETDVALLRVAGPTPEYLNLADDGAVRLGEPVFTVGFPAVDVLGEEPKYSEGSVGALAGLEGAPPSLQLSIAVQPGSSGGPVVNDHGEVVGIVESVADAAFFRGSDGLVPQPLSWAVQAGAVRDLVPDVEAPTPTESRAEAVQRVLGAVCLVEAR
jgi:S1-C subfamily serine protease